MFYETLKEKVNNIFKKQEEMMRIDQENARTNLKHLRIKANQIMHAVEADLKAGLFNSHGVEKHRECRTLELYLRSAKKVPYHFPVCAGCMSCMPESIDYFYDSIVQMPD